MRLSRLSETLLNVIQSSSLSHSKNVIVQKGQPENGETFLAMGEGQFTMACGAAVHAIYIAARVLRRRTAAALRHRSRLPGQSKLWRNRSAFMRPLNFIGIRT